MCRLLLFVLLFASAGCAGTAEPRTPSTVRIRPGSKGRYFVVDGTNGRPIPEREFARLYRARTGSTELDSTDHAHVNGTVVGGSIAGSMLVGSVLVGVLGIPHCEDRRSQCAAAGFGTGLLGLFGTLIGLAVVSEAIQGSPGEHDVPRARAEELVDAYNRTPPIGPPQF